MTALIQPVSPALTMAFLECKSEGHQWRHEGNVGNDTPGMRAPFGWTEALGRRSFCTCCGGERIKWYTRTGEVVNRYHYQDGYLHKRADPDDAAPSRRELRQTLVMQLFEDFGQPTSKRKAKAKAS